ncbi:MAG: endonuclease MutS2 [Erysipelothrix sp.]
MNNISSRLEFDKVLTQVAQYASFSLGKEAILASEPSYSPLIVKRDLNRMSEALRCVVSFGSLSFGGISDVSRELRFTEKGGVLSVDEIVKVGRFMQGINRLKKQFDALEDDYEAMDDLFASLEINQTLLNNIDHCFGEQGEVLDRASAELGTVRREMRQLEQTIDRKTQEFLNKNREMLSEAVVSLQQGRRTFLIKSSEKYKMEGTIYGESASGQSIYFEPAFLGKMQNDLLQYRHRELNEIEKICARTSAEIAEDAQQLDANLDTVTVIDALFAKAEWGYKHDAVVATMSQDTLKIVNARHPLINPKEVVANTYQLTPPHKMILISGPNTGGKSVSLKTMGLAVAMTHAGFPICAESATVMFVDQIFVDIGDQQSIEKSLSSFSAHMQTMTTVSQKATRKSLVLLDELGSQTDPLEGESLSMAILDHFREVGCWVVATTHFSRLKQYGTQYDDILIASVEFDLNNLKPTYRYRENIMGESNAFAIAKRLGLDLDIIDRAFKYKQESQYETDHMMEILEGKIAEQEKLNESLKEKETELHQQQATLQKELEESKKQLEVEREKLREENDVLLEDMIREAEKQMETLNKTNRPDLRQKAVKNIAKMQKEVIDETISSGDRVQLKATGQVGVVDKVEKNSALVTIGGLVMSVNLNKLTKIAGPAQPVKKKYTKSHSVKTLSSFKTEVNVIGLRVAEALPIVDKFIDECLVHNVQVCRVVHGHGTGTLRTAVHDSLRRNRNVKSFELASISEGGAGATVVKLK